MISPKTCEGQESRVPEEGHRVTCYDPGELKLPGRNQWNYIIIPSPRCEDLSSAAEGFYVAIRESYVYIFVILTRVRLEDLCLPIQLKISLAPGRYR